MTISLMGGIFTNGHPLEKICGADPLPSQREKINSLFGVEVHENNDEAVANADIILLAVKPQMMESSVSSIAVATQSTQPLFISIAAGIRVSAITSWLKRDSAIVRIMPNTPSLIQAGAAALYANNMATEEQKEIAETIIRSVGTAIWVENESLLDTVTALSGSGPAYFFLLMEVLEKAATGLGLNQAQARLLTLETAIGAAKMAIESELDVMELRQQVTSPGGTTEQALDVLKRGNIEKLFQEALTAAHQRSKELADTFGGAGS